VRLGIINEEGGSTNNQLFIKYRQALNSDQNLKPERITVGTNLIRDREATT
jgi:hypothetical protein